jgi:hypothetical protein
MTSGPGIPWEDRGSVGMASAFFKTASAAMVSPVDLVSKMRRPETARDARGFSYIIGAICLAASVIQSTFAYFVFYKNLKGYTVDSNQYLLNSALEAIAIGVGAVVMVQIAGIIFFKLIAFDMASKAPPVLVRNIVTYLAAPCLLGLIPGGPGPFLQVGPMLGLIWIVVLLVMVATRRLRVGTGAAIIGSFLTGLSIVLIAAAGYAVIWLLWCQVMGNESIDLIQVKISTPT